MRNLLYATFVLVFFAGCKGTVKDYLPGYSGRFGEVVVVIDNQQWDGKPGQTIKNAMATPIFGLPQPEAKFHLINIPERSFNKTFQSHRNILIVNVPAEIKGDKKAAMEIKTNSWATGQLVVRVSAENTEAFNVFFKENAERVVASFNNKEVSRLVDRNEKHGPKSVAQKLNEKHQLSLTVQKEMELKVNEEQFAWLRLRRERNAGGYMHQVNQDVFVFQQPYTDTTQLVPENILAAIDSIGKEHIPGPNDSSYFSISYRYVNPQAQLTRHNEQYAVFTQGLWRIENGFMGGPFVSLTTLDQSGQRIITVVGYVYAPQFPKREYLREVEAIVRSLNA